MKRKPSYPPFSYSALTDYEGCPRRFALVKLQKKYPFTETEALTYGRETHKAFELRVKEGKKLPPHLEHCEAIIAGLENAGYKLYAEIEIAITKDFKPVDYWDKSAWFRGSIDVLAVKGNELIILDWKTGKRYPIFGQLALYGLMLSITGAPEVKGVYVWLSQKKQDTITKTPGNYIGNDAYSYVNTFDGVREEYQERGAKFEAALQNKADDLEKWPTRPSPLCAFCPAVNDCEAGAKYKARRKYMRK
jgi:hypothetical protein